jgi:GAF domain-containing protein
MPHEQRLATAFTELSDVHNRDFSAASYMHLLARHAVRLVNVDAAGLLLVQEDGRLEAVGATTDAVRILQLIQLRIDDGPGVDSLRTRAPSTVTDLRSEVRWGTFRTAVLNAGFAAVHAVPMGMRGDAVGSLCLFRRRAGALTEDDLAVAEALVQVATACLLLKLAAGKADKLSGQLQTALSSRVAIEQAKGILAERRGTTVDLAFEMMRSFARHDRRQLKEVACAVVAGSATVSSLADSPVEKRQKVC